MFFSTLRMSALRQEIMKDITRKVIKMSSTSYSDYTVARGPTAAGQKWFGIGFCNEARMLSTLQPEIVPEVTAGTLTSKEESREFMAVFPDIVRDLTEAGRHTDIPEVTKWYTKILQHNVPNGKKSRGLAVVAAYKMLADPSILTPENVKHANIMGWCVEMLQAFFLVLDDVMDRAETRRGAPCWYKQEGVGFTAINDSVLIENGIYSILRRYFSKLPVYVPCIELFHDVTLKTAMGQALDNMAQNNGKLSLDSFTMSRYNSIVKYKTAYYSFQLPVALGMYMANKFDPEMHRQAKTILLEMGHFFQIQDDFLDCFGNSSVTGKIGSDIQEGKCSWLIVVALQRASRAQKSVLQANYGKSDTEAVSVVKNLYEELGLPNTYSVYEDENLNLIRTHIEQISKGLPHKLFFKILNTLYKRVA